MPMFNFIGYRKNYSKTTESLWKYYRDEPYNGELGDKSYSIRGSIPFSTKALLILMISAFFDNKSEFFGKNSAFTQSNSVRVVLEIF